MPAVRTFLSFDPPSKIAFRLFSFERRLARKVPGLVWVPPEQFHTTISFLGSVDEAHLPALLRSVADTVRTMPSFEISYEGVGVFPHEGPPEVLWVGCVNADGRLVALKESLDRTVRACGVEPSPSPFRPHLTLGRLRSERAANDLIPMLESLTLEPRRATIEVVHVMKSVLTAHGARHSVLAANPLQPSEPTA